MPVSGELKKVYSRLIDDSHDIESCDGPSIFGGLSLGVVKVGRDCYHGVGDLMTQICLCCFLVNKQKIRLGSQKNGDESDTPSS